MIFLKFILCVVLGVDIIGSYRQLDDKWTAVEEIAIWVMIVVKGVAIIWILST